MGKSRTTIPLLLLILGVMITPTVVNSIKATDESSYLYGYKNGRQGYQCSNFQADCDNGLSSCDVTIYSLKSTPQLTNKTACLNGYVDGWKQWCNTDLSLCAKFF